MTTGAPRGEQVLPAGSGYCAAGYRERVAEMAGAQGPVFGVLTEPDAAAPWTEEVAGGRATSSPRHRRAPPAVLIVAGQPQTRVGSHRMFTDLARMLAADGVASLRFDVGGWGDSPGAALPFEASDQDIAAAAAWLSAHTGRANARGEIWILGLCDGASAAVLALPSLRSAGCEPAALVLVNPWVRSEASLSDAIVRSYYAKRLFQREFWARLLSGQISFSNLLREPLRHVATRLSRGRARSEGARAREASRPQVSAGTDTPRESPELRSPAARSPDSPSPAARSPAARSPDSPSPHLPSAKAPPGDLPFRLLAQLEKYAGRALTVLSGNDLTAAETESLMSRDRGWRRRLERKGEILRVPDADHTFSEPAQWSRVARWVADRARER